MAKQVEPQLNMLEGMMLELSRISYSNWEKSEVREANSKREDELRRNLAKAFGFPYSRDGRSWNDVFTDADGLGLRFNGIGRYGRNDVIRIYYEAKSYPYKLNYRDIKMRTSGAVDKIRAAVKMLGEKKKVDDASYLIEERARKARQTKEEADRERLEKFLADHPNLSPKVKVTAVSASGVVSYIYQDDAPLSDFVTIYSEAAK